MHVDSDGNREGGGGGSGDMLPLKKFKTMVQSGAFWAFSGALCYNFSTKKLCWDVVYFLFLFIFGQIYVDSDAYSRIGSYAPDIEQIFNTLPPWFNPFVFIFGVHGFSVQFYLHVIM